MAAASFIRAAEDELACPICFESFTDPNTPKTLPLCGHVLCEVCLNDMAAGKCAKQCPECRKPVIFSKDGAVSFPTNYRLRNLAEKHQKVGDGQGLEIRPTVQPHQEQSKADSEVTGGVKAHGDHACQAHEGEPLDFCCTTCNVLACRKCVYENHIGPGHRCEKAKEKYDEQTSEMQVKIAEVTQTIQQAKGERQKLKILLKETQDCNDTAEKQIDEQIEACNTKLHEEGKRLKNQLLSKVRDIDRTLAQVDQEILSAETTHQCAMQSLRNEPPDYKNVIQLTSLVDQMNQLGLKECISQISATPYTAARFVVKSLAPDIGRIVSVMPGKAREVELMQTMDGFEDAIRIASSQDGLLLAVCEFNAKKVIIYRKASDGQYEKSHSLNLRSSNQYKPVGVAICSDGRFLVTRHTCIEVYNPEGVYLKSITTTDNTGTNVIVNSVIINSNGRILAGDVGRYVITEHDPTGNIVRTINTNIRPVYITLIHDSHIAMSDKESGKVSVMDMQSGQETLSIDIPEVQEICYDEQTECLLTVRSERASKPGELLLNTGVIEQYCCTTGRLVACLAQGLYHPQGMGFLSDGNLAIADIKSVKIYKIE